MFRTSMFLMLTSMAAVAVAQTQDPLAAAPVQYEGGLTTHQAAGLPDQRGDNTVMDCGLDDQGRPSMCPNDQVGYTPDDEIAPADDAPLFAPDYYAYEDYEYYPPALYYAGVSLWPAYYWPGYAWGWGGWGWGWGVPSISIGFGWGWHGGWGWGHHGWHDGYASRGGWHGGDHYHGPWSYDGHGHYADNRRDYGHNGSFAGRGLISHNVAANRNVGADRGFNSQGARNFTGAQNRSMGANREGLSAFNSANRFGANRGALPSTSYYSRTRENNNAQAFNRGNVQSANRTQYRSGNEGGSAGYTAANHQYSATLRGSSTFSNRTYSASMQNSNAMSNRTYQSAQRGYVPQQRSVGTQQRGSTAYVGGRGGPSYSAHPSYSGARGGYSGGHSYSAPHVSAPSHSSGDGGAHSSNSSGHHH